MIQLVLMGMGMGLAFAAPPGIVTAETLRRGIRGGFTHALSVQVGSMIGDASYALLAFLGLAALVQAAWAQAVAGGFGALLLLYLAWQSVQAPATLETVEAGKPGGRRAAFVSGMLLSLTNPWAVAFWVALGGSFIALGAQPGNVPLLFGGFMLGSLLWAFVLAGLIERARHLLSPRLFRVISFGFGLLLAGYGVVVITRVLAALFA